MNWTPTAKEEPKPSVQPFWATIRMKSLPFRTPFVWMLWSDGYKWFEDESCTIALRKSHEVIAWQELSTPEPWTGAEG